MKRYTSSAVLFLFGLAAVPSANADHGGSTHTNYNLTVPATSSSGNYTVTWSAPGDAELQERAGGGPYVVQPTGGYPWKDFAGKTTGTYTYRIYWQFCYYSCTDYYSAPETISVTVEPLTPSDIVGPETDYNGSFTLSWGSVSGATRYEVKRRLNGQSSWALVQNSSSTSISETGLASSLYHYAVRACDGTNCGGYTPTHTVMVSQPPSTPATPTGPTTDYNGSYTISWSSSSYSSSYRLRQKLNSGSWSQIYSGSGFSKSISGNSAGTYYYQVRGCNVESVCSAWSSTKTVTVVFPGTPTGLSGPSTDYNGSYTVSWNAAANATSYRLQERLNSGSWAQVYSGGSLSFAASGKGAGSYQYRVRGCNVESQCSSWSTVITVVVEAAPSTPANLTGPGTDYNGSYSISWNSSANSSTYTLQEKFGSGSWSTIYAGPAQSKGLTGNAAGQYAYRVRGCNAESVCSGWSATVQVTVEAVPDTPSGLTGPSVDYDGGFTVSWNSSARSVSYVLQQRIGSGTWANAYSGPALSKAFTGQGTANYSYRVKGCNAESECSGWSTTAAVSVQPPAIPNGLSSPQNNEPGSFTVNWAGSTGASKYTLQRQKDGLSWSTIQDNASTSIQETGLADAVWRYRVLACSTSLCSQWSATTTTNVASSPGVPGAVVGPEEVNATPGNYSVSWPGAGGSVTSYQLQESANGGTFSTIQNTSSTSKAFAGKPAAEYRYKVSACNTVGTYSNCSAWTPETLVNVQNFVSQGLTAPAENVTGSYVVSWQGQSGSPMSLQERSQGGQWSTIYYGQGDWFQISGKSNGSYDYRLINGSEFSYTVTTVVSQIPEPPIATSGIVAGNMPYDVGVTKGGKGYITIPVTVAPGVRGLEPALAILYSGARDRQRIDQQLPADTLGYGFSISGVANIRRCVKNQPNSVTVQLNNSSNDRLCLNGEPLVQVSGSSYWADGSVYRTLRDNYHKVVMHGPFYAPWFEVFAPDGSIMEFGNSDDSLIRNLHYTYVNGEEIITPAAPFFWSINRHVDAFGNEMTYTYHKDEVAGVNHPVGITYGNNGDATVEFEYVGRDDLEPVQLADASLQQNLLLHTIRISLDGTPVREYVLNSETTPAPDEWRRLDKVQVCAYDEAGAVRQCLQPLDFGWEEPTEALDGLKTYVSSITDSLGATTTIDYALINESGAQSFLFSERPFGSEIVPLNTEPLSSPPEHDGLQYVVEAIHRNNGIGGTHTTSYAYHGRGLRSTQNWGYLGFYGTRITDEQSGIVTYHQYRLDFPYFSRTSATRQFDGVFGQQTEELSHSEIEYQSLTVTHAGGVGYIPYKSATTNRLLEAGTEIGVVQQTSSPSQGAEGLISSMNTTTTVAGSRQSSGGGTFWGDVPTHTLSDILRTVKLEHQFDNQIGASQWLVGFASQMDARYFRGPQASAPLDQHQSVAYTRVPGTNDIDSETRFPGDAEYELETDYNYDGSGNVTSVSQAGINVPTRTSSFNAFIDGRYPSYVSNPLGHSTDVVYDWRFGNLKTAIDPNGRQTNLFFDPFGREISRTTRDGIVVTTDYDRCGVDVTCNAVGGLSPVLQVQTSSAVSPTRREYLDVLGRTVRTEVQSFDGTYVRQDTEYDALGRVDRVSAPYLSGSPAVFREYDYDLRNRVTQTIETDGGTASVIRSPMVGTGVEITTTQYVNDSAGQQVDVQQKVSTLNLLGEMTATRDDAAGENVRTVYDYYASGRPMTVTVDPSGANQTTSYQYDDAGNRRSVTGPDIGTVTALYTALNQPRQITDGDQNTISLVYDVLGRLETRTDPEGIASWTYDPANGIGALATRSYGSEFTEARTYNSEAKLAEVDTTLSGGGYTRSYQERRYYDSNGRPDRMEYPSGMEVSYDYNSYGYLQSVIDAATLSPLKTIQSMDAFGNVELQAFGNGVQTARSFDPATGRLTAIDTTLGGNPAIQDNEYHWQSNGILESRERQYGGNSIEEVFEYDGLNRLTKSETFVDSQLTRTLDTDFDLRGNLGYKTSSVAADTDVTGYQYSTGTNRLQSATIDGIGYSLSYDANGAITRYDRAGTGDDTFIAWNARQLPVTIVVGSSLSDPQPTAKDEFRYGPDGARFYKRSTWDDGGAQRVEHTFYVGPFEELLMDPSDPSHQAVQKSRIGSSLLHVRKIDHSSNATESIEYLHRDHLGSIEAVTDAQGAVVRDLAHDPFGTRRRDDGSRELDGGEVAALADDLSKGGGRGFTGHENLDRTGFVHMNGRVYDPRLGRFLSPDPVIQAPGFSQNWNRYSYVMNSPVSFTDPSGFITQGPMCGGLVMCMNPGGSGGGGGGGASSTYTTTSQAHIVNVSVSMQSSPIYGWVLVPVFNAQFSGSSIDPYHTTSYEWQRQQIDSSVSANAQTSSSTIQITQQRTVSESGETDRPLQVPNGEPGWIRTGASIGVGAIPGVGTVQSVVEVFSGRDYIEGTEVNRWLAGAGIVAGIVPGGKAALKGGAKAVGRLFGSKIPTPRMKSSPFGPKIEDPIPNGVPRNWSRDQIADAMADYRTSLSSRMDELAAFDSVGGGSATRRLAHARRITQEEDFLKSLEKAYESRR